MRFLFLAALLLAPTMARAGDAFFVSPPLEVAQSDGGDAAQEPIRLEGLPLARLLVERRRWQDALAVLRPLQGKAGVDQIEVHFLGALALVGLGKPKDAAEILRTILEARPDLIRVRLELARALFAAEDDAAARRHFELVLASEPAPAVAANIGVFLDRIRARRGWKTWINFGIAPDTNYNGGTYNDLNCGAASFGGGCGEITEDSKERSGVGAFVLAGAELRKKFSAGKLLIMKATSTRWEYKGSDVDAHILRAEPQLRVLKPGGYVEIGPVAQWRWSENDFYSKEFGLRISQSQRLGPRLSTFGRWESVARRFQDRPEQNDGLRHSLDLSGGYAIDAVTYAQGGVGITRTTAKQKNNGSFSADINLGGRREFGAGFTLGAYLNFSRTLWSDDFNLFDYRRKDNFRSLTLTALKRDWRIYGFAPEFSLSWSETRSNIDLQDNRRLRAGFNFTRDF